MDVDLKAGQTSKKAVGSQGSRLAKYKTKWIESHKILSPDPTELWIMLRTSYHILRMDPQTGPGEDFSRTYHEQKEERVTNMCLSPMKIAR